MRKICFRLKKTAEHYLDDKITKGEYKHAKAKARRKIEWIISREGDGEGERRKMQYAAQIISEIIREERFAIACEKEHNIAEI